MYAFRVQKLGIRFLIDYKRFCDKYRHFKIVAPQPFIAFIIRNVKKYTERSHEEWPQTMTIDVSDFSVTLISDNGDVLR